MFTAAQLTRLQNLAESAMVTQGYVVRQTSTPDNQGGKVKTWNAVTEDPVQCRVKRERREASSHFEATSVVQEVSRFKLKLPVGTDATVMDRFQEVDGPLYEIIGTSSGRSFKVEQTYEMVLINEGPTASPAGPPVGNVHGQQDEFYSDGTQTVFTLTGAPVANGLVFVYVDNVLQRSVDYTIAGTTLTFEVAPPASNVLAPAVLVRYWTQEG